MPITDLEALRFPIGKFTKPAEITDTILAAWTDDIAQLPARIRSAVTNLSDEQLNTPYRPEGWTVRQVVHHLPDSHANAYVRFKLALTEDNPTIKPYREDRWAELADGKYAPIASSLQLLEALHERWVRLIRSLTETDLQRTYVHPGYGKTYPLREAIGSYAWHSNHHLAHIERLRERMRW